jgi:hypothetical protein
MKPAKEQLVVEVNFPIEKDAEGYPRSRDAEALLCKPLTPECSICEVASVPFYPRNVAYGDTISTSEDQNGNLQFKSILKRGGYSVYRVLLRDPAKGDQLVERLLNFDIVLERDRDLIALAVPPTVDAGPIVGYLLEGKEKGYWGVQDGFICEVFE